MRNARRWIRMLVLVLAAAIIIPITPAENALSTPPAVHVSAQGAALIDVSSGRILYSHNGDKPMRVASLTKVMTAIVAIEEGKLSDMAKVSKHAFGKEGSSIYLKLGEEMSIHHLLYGLMLRSGNDAATTIAEHVGGSEEGFVYLMNEKANMLGMNRTSFRNPHGLDAEGHLSTANDMARLTAYALKNPVFQDIVKTQLKRVPNPNEAWDYTWRNKNKMLSLFEGSDGVKTGFTKSAGRCLISSATRNGRQLAVVTLNAPSDWADHAKLLNYGFENYPMQPVVKKGETVQGTSLVAGLSYSYPVAQGESNSLTIQTEIYPATDLHSQLGQKGKLDIYFNSVKVASIPLYEKDSPLLRSTSPTAFSYREGITWSTRNSGDFAEAVQAVLRTLFMAQP
jgi:serine-type D-Ala-D-Ala carboxypeptidase (penicillin-binding protein 5/6)